jgi:beta-N-acetylhexosaminidase
LEALDRLADRCLMPGFVGTEPPGWLLRRAQHLGGVCLYSRNVAGPDQVAALNRRLHAENPGLVIGIDEEGGDVTRLEAATGSSYPGNLALGEVDDVELTRSVALSMGAEVALAGVDLDLAPVADVNSNAANPVIGVRAFGAEPALVARHTAAWVEGLQGSGVAACVKHFPGHGATSLDSHLALPAVDEDPRDGALEPFQAAFAAGALAVMSAHIVVRTIDSTPATVSGMVMTTLLRDELGFDGLAVSDGLEMRAISDGVGIAEGAVLALAAGCDLLCIGGGLAGEDVVDLLRDAIVSAVREGRLEEQRLVKAANRIDRLMQWRSEQHAPNAGSREVGLEAARRAVRADGPAHLGSTAVVVQLASTPSQAAGVVPWGLAGPLRDRGVAVAAIELNRAPAGVDGLVREAKDKGLVLVARNLHRHPWQVTVVESVLALRPDAITVEMGLPGCRPAGAAAYVATYGAARVCGLAAAEALTR